MLEGALGGAVGFLALLGAVALTLRVLRSFTRFVLRAAEIAAASGMAEASARRGDLTALSEARTTIAVARSGRRRSLVLAVGWGAWLLVPLAVGALPEAWALAAPIWLLPGTGGSPRRPTGNVASPSGPPEPREADRPGA